jgi:hypothetical protein
MMTYSRSTRSALVSLIGLLGACALGAAGCTDDAPVEGPACGADVNSVITISNPTTTAVQLRITDAATGKELTDHYALAGAPASLVPDQPLGQLIGKAGATVRFWNESTLEVEYRYIYADGSRSSARTTGCSCEHPCTLTLDAPEGDTSKLGAPTALISTQVDPAWGPLDLAIDGQVVATIPADGKFSQVVVPAGTHTIAYYAAGTRTEAPTGHDTLTLSGGDAPFFEFLPLSVKVTGLPGSGN